MLMERFFSPSRGSVGDARVLVIRTQHHGSRALEGEDQVSACFVGNPLAIGLLPAAFPGKRGIVIAHLGGGLVLYPLFQLSSGTSAVDAVGDLAALDGACGGRSTSWRGPGCFCRCLQTNSRAGAELFVLDFDFLVQSAKVLIIAHDQAYHASKGVLGRIGSPNPARTVRGDVDDRRGHPGRRADRWRCTPRWSWRRCRTRCTCPGGRCRCWPTRPRRVARFLSNRPDTAGTTPSRRAGSGRIRPGGKRSPDARFHDRGDVDLEYATSVHRADEHPP